MSFYENEQAWLYGGGIQMDDGKLEDAEMDFERNEKKALSKIYDGFEQVFATLTEEEQQTVKGDLDTLCEYIEEMLEGIA